jgi:hypothetical protein
LDLHIASVGFVVGLDLKLFDHEKENPMTKFTLIGAAIVVSSALATPAMAQHALAHPVHYAQTNACQNMEPGNPYNRDEDYMSWSAWRTRGGWVDSAEVRCMQGSRLHHLGAGF